MVSSNLMKHSNSLAVTFVMPGRGRSGGVRVTVEMANELLRRGHRVRIAYPKGRWVFAKWARSVAQTLRFENRGQSRDWAGEFEGPIRPYRRIQDLKFEPGEIVIAVGTWVIEDVHSIDRQDVHKLRYCHGFSEHNGDEMQRCWGIPMSTISVSPRLTESIQTLTGAKPIGIVPNGIRAAQYYPERDVRRDGIGLVYSSNPKKAPEHAVELFREIASRHPDVPLMAFGSDRRPDGFPNGVTYLQYPSVDAARRLYNSALLWLVVSRSEGFCLPILEAMACGAAVVSTDHDTARGLVEPDQNGVLVPVGDTGAFLTVIDRLLADPDARSDLVAAGLQTASRFTWERAADQMVAVLSQFGRMAPMGPVAPAEIVVERS